MPLMEGLAATLLTSFIVSAWVALGVIFSGRITDDDVVALPLRILIGSGLTGFALAVFSLAGFVVGGTIVTGVVCVGAIAARRARAIATLRNAAGAFRDLRGAPVMKISIAVASGVMWLSAMAPPRSADAMRYHLAHIRLIAIEGRWAGIPDFHFALPFGWTFSFLPFELLGIAQGSQMLSVVLWLVIGASLIRVLRKAGASPIAIAIPFLLMLHPFVVRTFTEAGADPYSLLVVLVISLLLVRAEKLTFTEALAFGFAAWIGIQSRYQAVAVGLAATLVFLFAIRRHGAQRQLTIGATLGGLGALVLASPFYLANAKWFGNPVWPLMIGRDDAERSYANLVAWYYGRSLTGSWAPDKVGAAMWNLLTWPRLFPVALVIVVIVIAFLFSKNREVKRLSAFGAVFLGLWFMMQPLLYPKFALMMLPVAALTVGYYLVGQGEPRIASRRLAQVAMVAAVTVTTFVSRDALKYIVTGNEREYHAHTWFHPVYDWVNRNTARDAKALVIVSSGMTYYLERPYRRADPWIGGGVDWFNVIDGAALQELLEREGYRTVIYEERDWTFYRGGKAMQDAVADAEAKGLLRPVQSFDLRLYMSRTQRTSRGARVTVFDVSRRDLILTKSSAMASATTR